MRSRADTETIGTPNFDKAGRYVLTDYDQSKPFASFLPSVNGKYGMPMWSFYVNRGQAITSFGLANKDGPISQFKSATRAYQETEYTGFRSFLKIGRGDKPASLYEPFSSVAKHAVHRDMAVGMNEVAIVDKNTALGVQTDVTYFTMPDTDYPAFVRRATFTNTDESESVSLEVLDGIAQALQACALPPAGAAGEAELQEALWVELLLRYLCRINRFALTLDLADKGTMQTLAACFDALQRTAPAEVGSSEGRLDGTALGTLRDRKSVV